MKVVEVKVTHLLSASLLLTKRKKAGSHTRSKLLHVSTHDCPSADMVSLRALRGGQQGGAVEFTTHETSPESPICMNKPPGQTTDMFAGGNGASAPQKSWDSKYERINYVYKSVFSTHTFLDLCNFHNFHQPTLCFFFLFFYSVLYSFIDFFLPLLFSLLYSTLSVFLFNFCSWFLSHSLSLILLLVFLTLSYFSLFLFLSHFSYYSTIFFLFTLSLSPTHLLTFFLPFFISLISLSDFITMFVPILFPFFVPPTIPFPSFSHHADFCTLSFSY